MVLAAGRGERMRPLSDVLPKPALPLPGGPLVAWALHVAVATGVERIVVNAWHLPVGLRAALARVDVGSAEVRVSEEVELMGGAGGLALARDRGLLGEERPVLVLNADCVLDIDLGCLVEAHRAGGRQVTLAVQPHPDRRRWSRVVVDEEGRVRAIVPPGEGPTGGGEFLYTGVMVVSRAALDGLPAAVGGIGDTLWRPALTRGCLAAHVVGGGWREVGTPAAYLGCAVDLLAGRSEVDPSAAVDRTAVLDRCLVGRGARVEARARVRRSVVAEEARVGRGARVEDAVLLGQVEVAPGERVVGEVRARAPGGREDRRG